MTVSHEYTLYATELPNIRRTVTLIPLNTFVSTIYYVTVKKTYYCSLQGKIRTVKQIIIKYVDYLVSRHTQPQIRIDTYLNLGRCSLT